MSKFKVGDKVRCIESGTKGAGWKLGLEYIITEIQYAENCCFGGLDGNGVWEDSLELVEKTWDNLEVGDILIETGKNYFCRILGIFGEIIFLGGHYFGLQDAKEDINNIYTLQIGVVKEKYTIYQPEIKETVQELSMDEIAAKFGKEVSQIRIKKD